MISLFALIVVSIFIFYFYLSFPRIKKPVLYLYPIEDMNVSVNFEKEELLGTTYPKFKDSWDVFVKTDGSIYDKDGKYYYALY